ncbi:MAG: right-handed parallel beta-helix repeat-containing protein [Kiritimatiellales bacterium]
MIFYFLVDAAVNGQIELREPADNAVTFMTHPQFKWEADATADRYEIKITTIEDFSELVDQDSIPVPRYVPLEALDVNRDYWWRVRPQYVDGRLGEWSQERTFRVRRPNKVYSVHPDNTVQEIRNTISAAAADTPSRLVFSAGTYELDLPDETYLFDFRNVSKIYIDGGGAEFLFRNPNSGFMNLLRCSEMTVTGFNIDYIDEQGRPLTHTTGSIISTDADTGTFVFEPWSGYLPPTDPAISNAHFRYWGALMDTNSPGSLKVNVNNFYELTTAVTGLGSNQYRLYLDPKHWNRIADFEPGDVMVKNASYRMHVLTARRCSNITFERIRNYGASGNHFIGRWNDRLSFLRCSSVLKDGRLTSNPCGGYVGGGDATGFWIEGCETEGMMDDAVNCANYPVDVHSQINSNQFYAYSGDPAALLTNGSTMVHYNPTEAMSYGTYGVTGLETVNLGDDKLIKVTVDRDLGLIYPGRENDSTQFFIEALMHPDAYVRNCTFRNSRRIGCIFRSYGGVIEGNTFSNLSDQAIWGENNCNAFSTGFDNRNIRVLSNTIVRCVTGSAVQQQRRGSIEFGIMGTGKRCRQRLHRNVEIAHNTILDWSRCAISLENMEDVRVRSNVIGNQDAAGFWIPEQTYAIFADEAADVTITGNRITDTRPMTSAIYISNQCDNTVVSDNEMPE